MATKKVRLVDEETTTPEVETTETTGASLTEGQVEKLMKYAEAIDWKLWEILKLLRSKVDD